MPPSASPVASEDSGRWTRPVAVALVVVFAALLLLQWQWLGELTEARAREDRRRLQATVERIAEGARAAVSDVAQAVRTARVQGRPLDLPLVEGVIDWEPGLPVDVPHAFLVEHLEGPPSVVVLDPVVVSDELFPQLAEACLDPRDGDAYTLHASALGAEDGSEGASSSGGAAAGRADASTELRLVPNRWIELPGEGAGWMSQDSPVFVADGVLSGSLEGLPDLSEASASRWRLELRHVDGSIETALASTRRRRALLGGGVLAILLVGIGFLWHTEQRARRQAERELAFVAGVSHELRTPLAVVRTAASNLARGVVDAPDDVATYGSMIEREADRLGSMVERALRFGNDDQELTITTVDLDDVLDAAIARCANWEGQRAFAFARELASDARDVLADAGALTTLLHNLIENAIKYGADGQTIRLRARRSNDATIVIEVQDEGPGIPAEERERIFEPFYRAPAVRTGGIPGSGLGLGLARDLAHASGGRLELQSGRDERGATFVLRLPAAPSAERRDTR